MKSVYLVYKVNEYVGEESITAMWKLHKKLFVNPISGHLNNFSCIKTLTLHLINLKVPLHMCHLNFILKQCSGNCIHDAVLLLPLFDLHN